jgi:hypothetical protein
MTRVKFPDAPFRTEHLADWLEIIAIKSADGDSSAGDLQRELKVLNQDNADTLVGNVFTEIDRRVTATGDEGYPFVRDPTSIRLKGPIRNYPAYLFCLALSYCKWKTRKNAPQNPWLLFEELASYSARRYLGGESLVFGTSSRKGTSAKRKFVQAIKDLATRINEGEGFRQQPLHASKDSKLDIVAWKPFRDGRPSQVVLFGQCAAGDNWTNKLGELDPEEFWDQWFSVGKVSRPLRTVFIPHRVFDQSEWNLHARRARLLFDRCRVVAFAHGETSSGPFAQRLLQCCVSEWGFAV